MTRHPKECLFGDELSRIPPELRILFGTLVLTHAIEERMNSGTCGDGLSRPERHMLINLGIPRRMGQIAETLNTQPSTVTAVADSMERRGLLIRERDPDDRRAWQLRLTDAGIAARRALIESSVAVFRDLTGLEESEIGRLAAAMDKIAANILETGYPTGLTL